MSRFSVGIFMRLRDELNVQSSVGWAGKRLAGKNKVGPNIPGQSRSDSWSGWRPSYLSISVPVAVTPSRSPGRQNPGVRLLGWTASTKLKSVIVHGERLI